MTRSAALVLALGVAASPVAWAAPASAATSGSSTVGASAAEWYRVSPTCATPAGCEAAPLPSPYTAGTLHVGVLAGMEESRSYLQLDTASLPAGAQVTGGQLRLTLATGLQDGTLLPESAKVRACLVTGTVAGKADGAFSEPPGVDCAVTSPASFVAAAGEAPAALTVDLTPFARDWSADAAPGALALVPAEAPAQTDVWHVAFAKEGGVSAALQWTAPDSAAVVPLPPAPPMDAASGGDVFAGSPDVSVAPLPQPGPGAPAGPEVAPLAAGQPAVQQQALLPAAVTTGGFAYPAVFLLPLALAGFGGVIARAMTRDLVREGDTPR